MSSNLAAPTILQLCIPSWDALLRPEAFGMVSPENRRRDKPGTDQCAQNREQHRAHLFCALHVFHMMPRAFASVIVHGSLI